MKLVVKSLVIEWPDLDGVLRRPIWGPSGRGPPGSGGKVKLVVKGLVIEWLDLDDGSPEPDSGAPQAMLQYSMMECLTSLTASSLKAFRRRPIR